MAYPRGVVVLRRLSKTDFSTEVTVTAKSGDKTELRSFAAVPRHVAIVMDGNGRWAKARGKARHAGHRAGVKTVQRVAELCGRYGVEVLTLFAFSSENWGRPASEVSLLMELFARTLDRELDQLIKNKIRLRVIGDTERLPKNLQRKVRDAESRTAEVGGVELVIAASYGGRWDIAQAAREIAADCVAGRLDVADVDEEAIGQRLALADLPEPDLFIRTAGEQRISNFLLWQLAYTELHFSQTLWPDFGQSDLEAAFEDFAGRQRRYGLVEPVDTD